MQLFQHVGANKCAWVYLQYVQLQERQHFVILDLTYQGFASGDVDKDAAGLRKLVADGNSMAVCQSFSKNMSLYGEN